MRGDQDAGWRGADDEHAEDDGTEPHFATVETANVCILFFCSRFVSLAQAEVNKKLALDGCKLGLQRAQPLLLLIGCLLFLDLSGSGQNTG